MAYLWAQADGTVVEAAYDSTRDSLSPEQVGNELRAALTQFGREVECQPVSVEQNEVYSVSFDDGKAHVHFYVAIKEMTPGGRDTLKDEQRIQQKCKYINYAFEKQAAGEKAVCLGVYKRDGQTIFCAWKLKKSEAATPDTPVSKQMKIQSIADAMKEGFVQYLQRNNNEYACAFRKEFIFFYLKNYTWLHDGVVKMMNEKTEIPSEFNGLSKDLQRRYNRIVFGAPGTGKSHRLEEDRVAFGDNYERVTFHSSYSYSQFVGTYKPSPVHVEGKDDTITYRFIPGPFMRILAEALKNPKTPYLLLIEEINRANPASVFGDVFQLLDRVNGVSEYPIAISEDMKSYLLEKTGQSFQTIVLPDNLYIWATMNSADQGVFPIDSAFKRRWNFEYMGINEKEEEVDTIVTLRNGNRMNWNSLRHEINRLLIMLKVNEDKLIGPFFLEKGTLTDKESFNDAFISKILMYLFEDAARHRRVDLFAGCESSTYSSVCTAYEIMGEKIFGLDLAISSKDDEGE